MRSDLSVEALGIQWTRPMPLAEAVRGAGVPVEAGLYRIRRVGIDGWDYIGQTGTGRMNLRLRMRMLRGIYADQMPYRDPHTAGPGLWALRRELGASFEVSFCPVRGETPWRKALEAVSIALHRQRYARSPTLNFGRMPAGYRMSSGNNARLVAAGKRFRGGPWDAVTDAQAPGEPPVGPLDPDTACATWCGHDWCDWAHLTADAIKAVATGLGIYRIKGRDGSLTYIGEGSLRQRLLTHAAKLATPSPQGTALANSAPLMFSTVLGPDWLRHQRLELETDLIAAYVLAARQPPAAQFIG